MTAVEAIRRAFDLDFEGQVFLGRYIYNSQMTQMTPILISSRKDCVYSLVVTDHEGDAFWSLHRLPSDDVTPYGPDVAPREGKEFIGFFGSPYDQLFLLPADTLSPTGGAAV